MSDENQTIPVFDEKEINAILKRAVEMQEQEGTALDTGLTQKELEQVAADVGIDPRFIAAAVAERASGDIYRERLGFWGGPLSFTLEKQMDVELSEETWENVVSEIRKTFGETGRISQWSRSLEWTTSNKASSQTSVTVTTRNGRTKINVLFHAATLPYAFYLPVLLPALLFSLVFLAEGGLPVFSGVGIVAAIWVVLFSSVRWIFTKVVEKQRNKMRLMLDRIDHIVADQSSVTNDVSVGNIERDKSQPVSSGLLELDTSEEIEETTPVKPRRRTSG